IVGIDELIARLPPAWDEQSWDANASRWIVDPAVLEMKRRIATGTVLTSAQWARALTRTHIIGIRGRWPADRDVQVAMTDSLWLPDTEIRLKTRDPQLAEIRGGQLGWELSGNAVDQRQRLQARQRLGLLPTGNHRLTFDVEVERGQGKPIDALA